MDRLGPSVPSDMRVSAGDGMGSMSKAKCVGVGWVEGWVGREGLNVWRVPVLGRWFRRVLPFCSPTVL